MVSDVAQDGYTDIPERIMRGYSVLAAEAMEQLPAPPTHLFLQAGVGGLAAPVAAYFADACSPPPGHHGGRGRHRSLPDGKRARGRLDAHRKPWARPISIGSIVPRRPAPPGPILRTLATAFVGVEDDVAAEAARVVGARKAWRPRPPERRVWPDCWHFAAQKARSSGWGSAPKAAC